MQRRILRAIEGRLALEELFELEEHARTCARCGKSLAEARALEEALLALPAPPLDRLDVEGSLERIHRRIDQRQIEAPGREDRSGAPRRWIVRFSAGLIAAAALVLALLAIREGERPEHGLVEHGENLALSPARPEDGAQRTEPSEAQDALAEPAPLDTASELQAFDPLAWATDYDGTRHAWAREEIAQILRECGTALAEDDSPEARSTFLSAFDERARPLATAGWPILRLVQRFVADPDAELGRAAALYVGARGDRVALHELALVLGREDRKRAAALALSEAGAAGLEELRAAIWDPALAPLVLTALERSEASLALVWIERVMRDARAQAPTEVRRSIATQLTERLASLDAGGARLLFALADHPLLERKGVLDAFSRTEGARELVVESVRASRSSDDDLLLLEALARLPAAECFDWIVRRARGTRSSMAALHALARYPGIEPVQTLLDLRTASSRDDDPVELAAWCEALEVDPARFVELAGDHALLGDPSQMRRFLEVLVLTEHPAAAPALIALARRETIDDEDREHAVLAAGELGSSSDVSALEELVAQLGPPDARLAAAACWSAFVLAGESGVRTLLGDSDLGLQASLVDRLSAPSARARRTSTLFQLARMLEPWLDRTNTVAKETR